MTQGPDTLVCFAVKEEAKHFMRLAAARPEIQLLLTGMGGQNAERTVRAALAEGRPKRVITAGFAGGLNPKLARGDILYHAEEGTELANDLRAAGAHAARFYCAPSVVATARSKEQLFLSTKADAVEMESCVIYKLCSEQKISAAIVRVILDTAGEDLVLDFNKVMTGDLRIDPLRLALEVLKSPGSIPGLLRLQKQSSLAAGRLADVLTRLLF